MRLRSAARIVVKELAYNRVLTHVPYNPLRIWWLRRLGADLGDHVHIFSACEVHNPLGLSIAGGCHIGRHGELDARGGLSIGRNAVIAGHCLLISADHDPQDPGFVGRTAPIRLGDRVWLGVRVTVLKGVTVGEGAVIAAGSVVTKDVAPWSIVAGVPAEVVGQRSPEQTYVIDYGPKWL